MRRRKEPLRERYDLARSPFAQKPTQRDLAKLMGISKRDLIDLRRYKEECIERRDAVINRKLRRLAYPVGPLRRAHERLKFHFNKIRQPKYLLSPRAGMSPRDNAIRHLDQNHYLTLDIRQFYPSTSKAHIRNWLENEIGMFPDVASLLANLVTVDGAASFGSPLTPVLVSLVHRPLFEAIRDLCDRRGLELTLWVDDITISGKFVPGELLGDIRSLIAEHGLLSHEIQFRTGNRPVFITGIGVVGKHLVAPNALHKKIRDDWKALSEAETDGERESLMTQLLSKLGTLRYIVGRQSEQGRKAADTMHSLRQKRDKLLRLQTTSASIREANASTDADDEVPW